MPDEELKSVEDLSRVPLYEHDKTIDPNWYPEEQKLARLLLHQARIKLNNANIGEATEFIVKAKAKNPKFNYLSAKHRSRLQKGLKQQLRARQARVEELTKIRDDALTKAINALDTGTEVAAFEVATGKDLKFQNSVLTDFEKSIKPLENAELLRQNGLKFEDKYEHDIQELGRILDSTFILEKPQGTSLHHFLDFLEKEDISGRGKEVDLVKFLREGKFQSFIIEHDWAKAFEGVPDFRGGEVRLPYEFTCFEFRISGIRHLILLGKTSRGATEGIICTGLNKRWYINSNSIIFNNGEIIFKKGHNNLVGKWLSRISDQIRAVCIMLDASVAMTEPRNIGSGLIKKRKHEGKCTLPDYRVVVLSKRLRGGSHEKGDPTGIRKRLHWRRGHYHHYKSLGGKERYIDAEGITRSKTWYNWQLVGDENLGFVEKHYRL